MSSIPLTGTARMNRAAVRVIGGGLAGCEAAYQLSRRGIAVDLYEMKPGKKTPAHHTDLLAELVCSNSLRSDRLENAVGLLKQEMRERADAGATVHSPEEFGIARPQR